jgi:hypothetical protein
MQLSGVRFAESRILQAISKHESAIMQAIEVFLNRCITNGFEGTNAVSGLWIVNSNHAIDPVPRFYVGVGEDEDVQFNGPTCLARNVLNKGNAAAQAGMDTLDMVNDPVHFLVVEGPYFPKGGAIIRRIGRVEFVISTSGFTPKEDHEASVGVWSIILNFIVKDIADDLRRADLDENNPEYVKYPVGRLFDDDVAPRAVGNSKGELFSSGWGAARVSPGYAGG